jgi:hypothetical protein
MWLSVQRLRFDGLPVVRLSMTGTCATMAFGRRPVAPSTMA